MPATVIVQKHHRDNQVNKLNLLHFLVVTLKQIFFSILKERQPVILDILEKVQYLTNKP